MVAIDVELEHLKAAQKDRWRGVPGHPDVTPAHAATLLWEHLRELGRREDTARRPADYRAKLAEAERAADVLRTSLRGDAAAADRDANLKALGQTCAGCHRAYRN